MEYNPYFPEEEQEQLAVVRLSRVTYELAEGQPDAMGWGAADADGIIFGTVSDMLADAMTGQILFVAISHNQTGKTALVPVDGVFLDIAKQIMLVPIPEAAVMGCPDFTEDVVDLMPFVDYWYKLSGV